MDYFDDDPYREFIYLRTYSRWRADLERRELWTETVERYMKFMRKNLGDKLTEREYTEIESGIINMDILPSMRLLWSAGTAAEKNNASAYNCSYLTVDAIHKFSETLFLLTSGCGVGFSCERDCVERLPEVQEQTGVMQLPYVIPDSREGWADALKVGMSAWYAGEDIEFDYSEIRPRGFPLKTFGGRASGPAPLKKLLEFAKKTILGCAGRKLRPIEVHDIMCMIGEIVVSGGTRRSSLISLSDLDDEEMRSAKSDNFPEYRYMANNSAVYNENVTYEEFKREWAALIASNSGERGIFNRDNSVKNMPERRLSLYNSYAKHNYYINDTMRDDSPKMGTNPCGEILLRPSQLCNLSNVIIRPDDTRDTILKKVQLATILGTYQATLTNFTYLSEEWKKNCEEERLLGVSLTGLYDNAIAFDEDNLQSWRGVAVAFNRIYAERFGINPATSVTCIKPSGNTSQLVNSSSGIHPRYAPYYIRRVRISSCDPLVESLKSQGIRVVPEVGQDEASATTLVAEFPQKSPKGAVTRGDVDAFEQLEDWKTLNSCFTEHTVSATIYVEEDEWDEVGMWVWQNWDHISGLSFLPKMDNGHVYELAPYEEITEQQYNELVKVFDVSGAANIRELTDETEGSREFACAAGGCLL